MSEMTFPKNFLWGAATASYQIEGAANEDGRGLSIWDTFSRRPGAVMHGHTGDVACDHYHRYAEDVRLLHELGVGAYRFSIAWPRIFPTGQGTVNAKGADFYHRLLDELLAKGIAPVATLYHWDLPQALEDAGGWPARDTAYRFAEYSAECYRLFGDKIKTWITLNEPGVVAYNGYEEGIHAPGVRNGPASFAAVHHLNLAHALAVQAFRQGGHKGQIGITHTPACTRPATARREDIEAADRGKDKWGRVFLDPLYKGTYPQRLLDAYPDRPMPIRPGDMETLRQKTDFLGLNYYREYCIRYDAHDPERWARVPTYHPQTEMEWDIVPDGLYRLLKWLDSEYGHPVMHITENGCALKDELTADGMRCHDAGRVDFLRQHLRACLRAMRDGVDLRGYFVWTLMDNYEWSLGYTKRFGIIYCDYVNQRRVPKDSYHFYRDVVAGNEWF